MKAIIERHKTLIPKVQETLVKTECYWKCYSYGDDLIPIFEFIDDLRNRSCSKYILKNNYKYILLSKICQGDHQRQQRDDRRAH